ncbi:MAG: LLM class flavin-dependent oxidoreductase [SAR202 cluster bacterium]|jgi:alkanesulfonate monooxygenase SsuD/methylene tetrahydromethanopterin reductase-like flavin-dependent oxidoreductase (luciferase family)|nr:LLM class flavin-dependent oxidoreductase [SAR202 cluster bacterium]
MEYGVHLPLIGFDDTPVTLQRLQSFTETVERLGFRTLCANDHLVFAKPWFDGPTALASVLDRSGDMTLATTVSIPVVRGPAAMAKTLAAIDILSGGRLIAGIGPGSSALDYEIVGVPFEERWKRVDESVLAMRAYWRQGSPPFEGDFYSTNEVDLAPHPHGDSGIPMWIGSWGSAVGLRRAARLGDGWLASGYNTTPTVFGEAWVRLGQILEDSGKDPSAFPNAIASMFYYVTEDRDEARRTLTEVVGTAINRPIEELAERLPIGPAQECAEKLAAYEAAGAQRIYMWPVADELNQLETFWNRVVPLV